MSLFTSEPKTPAMFTSSGPWWEAPRGEVFRRAGVAAKQIMERQRGRIARDWRHARLYSGMNPDVLDAFGMLGLASSDSISGAKLVRFTFNCIESVIETAASRTASNEISPTYQSDGGDWDLQERAELLTQWVGGAFQASEFRLIAPEAAVDAMVFGTGATKSFMDRGVPRTDRVFPLELLVDAEDGMRRKPRQMFHMRPVAREVAIATWGDTEAKKRALRAAPRVRTADTSGTAADMVGILEGWHLPSGPDVGDGRWIVCCENTDLHDERWEQDRFPVEFLRWRNRLLGFWGVGIAEQLTGIQIEINRVVAFVQASLSASAFKIFLETGSKVIKSHINKEMGGIIEYQGSAPTYFAPKTLEETNLSWLMQLYDKAFEVAGVSKLSAQQIKPAGLDSKPALRAFDDIQDARFVQFGKRYEQMHVNVAESLIEEARRAHEDGTDLEMQIRTPGSEFTSRARWSDIDLKRDQYSAQVAAESALPRTPAARRQAVQEDMQAGLLTPEQGRRLLNYPDLKSELDLADAPRKFISWQISRMLKGKPQTPEPLQDLSLARELVTKTYNLARTKSVPEPRLQLLREYLSQLDAFQQMGAPPQGALPPGPGGPPGPMAKPEAPPTSPLLPVGGAPPPPMPT